jgi:hypothetical protein
MVFNIKKLGLSMFWRVKFKYYQNITIVIFLVLVKKFAN